ncbi:MAG: TetR/AcrR family transcriptional regulator [Proteobacteria bacterium]|nr:TetR/AcrR family transcriptional regulator [Pseudomonadota bacterium]
MSRPREFDQAAAIETAMNEIWKNGYEACSVKALSEKLNITRSSFYNAFGSREALFKEALARYFDQSPDKAFATAKEGVRVKALVTRTFRKVCRVRASDPAGRGCMAINSAAELCNVHEELGNLLADAILGSLSCLEKLLQWGVKQGEIDEDADTHALALALQNLLIGLNLMCKVVRDEAELWLAAETTLRGLSLLDA